MDKQRHLRLGEVGEAMAVSYLQKLGLKIVERRLRYRRGELDIVARDGREWVFVEVKTRSGGRMGFASEAFTSRKLGRLARAARQYIADNDLHDVPVRYDLVAIDFYDGEEPEIAYYPNSPVSG